MNQSYQKILLQNPCVAPALLSPLFGQGTDVRQQQQMALPVLKAALHSQL
jgi:hypothetical protein